MAILIWRDKKHEHNNSKDKALAAAKDYFEKRHNVPYVNKSYTIKEDGDWFVVTMQADVVK